MIAFFDTSIHIPVLLGALSVDTIATLTAGLYVRAGGSDR